MDTSQQPNLTYQLAFPHGLNKPGGVLGCMHSILLISSPHQFYWVTWPCEHFEFAGHVLLLVAWNFTVNPLKKKQQSRIGSLSAFSHYTLTLHALDIGYKSRVVSSLSPTNIA